MELQRSGAPILLDSIRSTPVMLERINADQWTTAVLGSGNSNAKASETDLQDLLAVCPSALPFQQFSSVFYPSVCIGREVGTPVGPIDCLFISGQGRLTIVETKLYKNPEARRAVVAQLLDYCDQASRFSFQQLDDCAREFAKGRHPDYQYSGLRDFVSWSLKSMQRFSESNDEDSEGEWVLDDDQFQAQTAKSVRRGEILGLIVGDQIDKRIVSLLDFAKSKQGLALELGIVELAFYRPYGQRTPLLAIPSIIEWAIPVSRTVVDVRVDTKGAVTVNVESAGETDSATQGARPPQLASNLEFMELVQGRIPLAADAMGRILSTMQQVADASKGTIELAYQTATANLYWVSTDGRLRRFFALAPKNAVARVWTDYLRNGGYEQLASQVENLTLQAFPQIRGQGSFAIKVPDNDTDTICELLQKLADVFAVQAEE